MIRFTFDQMFRFDGKAMREELPLGWFPQMKEAIETLQPPAFTIVELWWANIWL